MRVTFVLPGSGHIPVGGFKVVYEYANHLSARGHTVNVVQTALFDHQAPLSTRLKAKIRFIQRALDRSYHPDWFSLRPEVQVLWSQTGDPATFPDADVLVATAWQTAEWLGQIPPGKGRGYYLIQHYETWSGPKTRVDKTFHLGLRNLVIARWLQNELRAQGAAADYLPNGLDLTAFGVDTPPETRAKRVMMLYHEADWKGSADGLEALGQVKAAVPELTATLFGTPAPPPDLPAWIRYVQRPDPAHLRALYNESAVFLATAWSEGWGLPGCEALLCGCALAATDVGGHREYARHRETALLSPPRDPAALATNTVTLLEDKALRLRLAEQGRAFVRTLTWERATERLEALLGAP